MCMDNIKKTTCDQTEITSVDDNSDAARWNSVYSMFLFENLTISSRNDNKKRLPYVPYISDQLHGTENMVCGIVAEHNGCNIFKQCDDTKYPGGYFILISFVTINNLFRNFYEGVQHARGDIQTAIPTLGSTFSPIAEEGLSTAVIIDLVTMGYLGAAAPFWNSITKKLPYFRQRDAESGDWRSVNANTHGTLKDFIKGMVTSSLTLAKDLTAAEAENAVDGEISKLLGAMIGAYSEVIDGRAKTIFNGESSSTQWLYEIKRMVAKPIYAQMIPRAWRMSNLPVGPFTLDTGLDCNDDGDLERDDIVDRILDSGIQTAGLVMLPVCDGWDARANWARAYNTIGNNFHPWDKYPCDG